MGLQAIWLTIGFWASTAALFLLPLYFAGFRIGAAAWIGVLTTVLLGIPVSAAIFLVAVRLKGASATRRYLVVGAVTLVCATGVTFIDAAKSAWLMSVYEPQRGPEQVLLRAFSNLPGFLPLFAVMASTYLILIHNQQAAARARELAEARDAAQRAALAASAAQSAAARARLAALRYQLNPHFLFNTLNTISSAVVVGRPDAAEAMLAKLAAFLRSTLSAPVTDQVTLDDELAAVADYLEIEHFRLEDRLAVEMNCPPELRLAGTPSFVLQPLVENAVKHGVGSTSRTVTIRIDVERRGEQLAISVADDGEGAPGASGLNLGLSNVAERLATLYGERAGLSTERLGPGFRATVTLPLDLASAA